MLRKNRWFYSLVILMLLFAVPRIMAEAPQLTILFTHDLHDHLQPFTVLDNEGLIRTVGGYARIQSLIQKIQKLDPELVLVDAGDFSMGTLFQTIFASHAPQLRLMGKMGYDAITFGNHEFDFRALGLADSLTAAKNSNDPLPPITVANINFPKDQAGNLTPSLGKLKEAMNNYPIEDYIIIERKGVRIGIFGLMGKDSASNAPMAEVEFTDPVTKARSVVEKLKVEQVDLILCLSHSGTGGVSPNTEDEVLAEKIPDIDIIISGHSHTLLEKPIVVGNTIIGSAGEYGQNLGLIKVAKSAKGGWELIEYALKPIDESLPEDEEIINMVRAYQEIVQKNYLTNFGLDFQQILAYSPFNFTPAFKVGKKHAEEPLGNLISDAYIHAVQAAEGNEYEPIAVSLVPSGTIRGSFVQGPVTTSDVFVVSSLGIGEDGIPGYPLVSVYLTGKELKTMCEIDASVAPFMKAAQLYMAGINYTFNPNRFIFNKVTEVSLELADGTEVEIEDDKLYRVVAGLYSGQMLPTVTDKSFGILSVIPKTKKGDPIVDFAPHIIKDEQGKEVKEWFAIAQYLASFEPKEGIPQIPQYYSETQGRKNILNSKNILLLLEKPNMIAITFYAILLVLILVLVLLIIKVSKWCRRRNKRTS